MRKLFQLFLFNSFVFGCAASTSQALQLHPTVSPPTETTINTAVYQPPVLPADMRTIRIRPYTYPPAAGAAVATITQGQAVTPTFNGICLNDPALATIESDINTTLRTDEINRLTSLGVQGASAIRDIEIARNDAAIQRVFYEAQIRDRNDQVTSANRIIHNLEDSMGSGPLNVLRTVGWVAGGVALGVAVSGIYVLLNH